MNIKSLRRLKRRVLTLIMPDFISHKLIRASLNLPKAIDKTFTFKLAESRDEQNQALELLHDAYLASGYMKPSPSKMRITPYHMLPCSVTPIVKKDGKVVATMSIFLKGDFGVPLESICKIEQLFSKGDRVVEVSSLAVDKSASGERGEVLFPLMKFMYRCNVDLLRADYEFIGINPKMVPLYKALLLFEPVPVKKNKIDYSFVNDAPVVPLMFSLKSRYITYEKYYAGKKKSQNLLKYFESPLPENFILPATMEEFSPPHVHPDQFEFLFCQQSNVLKEVSAMQMKVLLKEYQGNEGVLSLLRRSNV